VVGSTFGFGNPKTDVLILLPIFIGNWSQLAIFINPFNRRLKMGWFSSSNDSNNSDSGVTKGKSSALPFGQGEIFEKRTDNATGIYGIGRDGETAQKNLEKNLRKHGK